VTVEPEARQIEDLARIIHGAITWNPERPCEECQHAARAVVEAGWTPPGSAIPADMTREKLDQIRRLLQHLQNFMGAGDAATIRMLDNLVRDCASWASQVGVRSAPEETR